MSVDGSCYTGIVEEAVAEARECAPDVPIVVRSTVPPGTCEAMKVAFMPEFLTEKNWTRDVYETKEWIIGSCDDSIAAEPIVADILRAGNDSGILSSCALAGIGSTRAELIKYGKNAFLATKVSFFNELSSLCQDANVSFDAVRKFVSEDERIGSSHTYVPGHDGHKGFGGTCLPKDIHALASYARERGVPTPVINSVIFRNDEIDRTEKDWKADKGRAVVDA
jgi:UDPglucose 6-dehydrogenase